MLKYDWVMLALYAEVLLASMCELLMMHLSRCHSEPFAPSRGGKTAKISQNHLAIIEWHAHTHSFLIITSCELNK